MDAPKSVNGDISHGHLHEEQQHGLSPVSTSRLSLDGGISDREHEEHVPHLICTRAPFFILSLNFHMKDWLTVRLNQIGPRATITASRTTADKLPRQRQSVGLSPY
jgi:hypothetical protein